MEGTDTSVAAAGVAAAQRELLGSSHLEQVEMVAAAMFSSFQFKENQ